MSKNAFDTLTPDLIMQFAEDFGFVPTGQLLQLNSFENRVFDIFVEAESTQTSQRIILKVYRPGRWTAEQLLEEHQFLAELHAEGVPVLLPYRQPQSAFTLSYRNNLAASAFSRFPGRLIDELLPEHLAPLGRVVSQLHNVGARKASRYRLHLNIEDWGDRNLELLRSWIAPEVSARYQAAATGLLDRIEPELGDQEWLRIHGDLHQGNILSLPGAEGFAYGFVDFDDFMMGPPAQDFWMLLPSPTDASFDQHWQAFWRGYTEFRHTECPSQQFLNDLRGLRIISYAAWIAKRWSDPSFPRLFPQFLTYSYWAQETEALERILWTKLS